MRKKLLSSLLLGMLALPMSVSATPPTNIQDGNILHCFDWPISSVRAELANIAAAGFGAIQLSPLQRADVSTGSPWHDLYRPYDLAFKGGLGSESELQSLCSEASAYGIKIIVDVVANHVDKTSGYHDTWWDSNNRVRWEGYITDYSNRYQVTHGQLGDYGDVNSELTEVQERAKAYVQKLADLGVKGIRWDAAKHIGLPSEGCNFWPAVTSVSGVWHYGEILDEPASGQPALIKEYAQYMSVTDNKYSNGAARDNGGIPYGYAGAWVAEQGLADSKLVYWGESHDTYSNDEWSQNVDQSVIDRAYASMACRNGATALYLSRPTTKGFSNIKVGKGTDAYQSDAIRAVNNFRNAMVGKDDYFSTNGSAISVTRKGGGAVIVMKGSGNVSVPNGGGYCPTGTYTDKVSGGTFTVTSETISGNVGSTGIAVIYDGQGGGDDPTPTPTPTPSTSVTITGDYNVAYSGSKVNVYYWGGSSQPTWPGEAMTTVTGSDGNTYKVAKVASGTTGIIFNTNGDADKTADLTYTGSYVMDDNGATSTAVTFTTGGDDPTPTPTPTPTGHTVYYDNSSTNWSTVYCYAWSTGSSDQNAAWPGVAMSVYDGNVYSYSSDTAYANVIFNNNSDQTDDLTWYDGHIYKRDGSHTEYSAGGDTTKPVVTASPTSTTFNSSISVTLSVNPSTATIYYTTDGSTPTSSSSVYSSALTFTSTTTLKAVGIATDGTAGDVVTYTYTYSSDPTPTPTPSGDNLITNYYKVNPDGKVGTNKTINMSFNGQNSTTALSNWTEAELIAQGVARDVCQAMKGYHERPIVDSYAIYAAWDNDYLYLGAQFVYTIWDLGGEGKQPGESKPYNMDGHMMWAFDLDPNASFDGLIGGAGPIWNEAQEGATFDNGVDAVWMGSTKPGVGTPGFFTPTPDGHASYDAAYCKSISGSYYGYADGLLPSITAIYGQSSFGFDPEALKGNDGFVDLSSEIDASAHTFYEWKFPLSTLGITADYIKNTGIGVMYIDKYGSSPVGGTPYDPSYFDNVMDSYSQDPSSSKEKEDKDIITYAPARIGKLLASASIDDVAADTAAASSVSIRPVSGGVKISGLQGENVQVVAVDGRVLKSGSVSTSDLTIELPAGMYVVRAGSAAKTVMVK